MGVYSDGAMSFLRGYASDAYAIAKGYIEDLSNYVAGTISTVVPSISVTIPSGITIDPALQTEIPDAPADSSYPSVPGSVTMRDYDFPTRPTYTLPVVPTFHDITIPDYVEGSIRDIESSLPEIDFSVPAVSEIATSEAPLGALVGVVRDKLSDNILYGGTMLDPTVEAHIWNRDRERREQALQDAVDKAMAQWAKLGFNLPDGLLSGALLALNNEYLNKDLDASREIAIKQAELEQQGMFKSLELGISVETMVLETTNKYLQRVVETQKYTADVTVEIYKQRVTQYNAMLEKFKVDVESYKASIQAEISRAEAYKARIAGLQAVVSIDEAQVKLYTSHVASIEQLVSLYSTEVKAVATQYDAEKQRIEGFKAQIEAYIAQVEAITKKYSTQIEGFKAYVSAYTASADSQSKLTELRLKGEVAELEATLKAWEIQYKLINENTSLRLEALKTVATTSSHLAAGSLSAIHASVSDSFNNSLSTSHSYTY